MIRVLILLALAGPAFAQEQCGPHGAASSAISARSGCALVSGT